MDKADSPYSNREIQEKWNDIASTLQEIKTQTKLTNGRVTSLEKWQYTVIGGVAVLTLIVVPLLGWALYILSNIQSQVTTAAHQAVDDALSAYDIQK